MRDQENIWFDIDEQEERTKILVVDDDVYQREALKVILKLSGIDIANDVDEATNGMEAFQMVTE